MELLSTLITVLLSLAMLLAAWYAGTRWGARNQQPDSPALSQHSYFRGLNFLINEEPDESIDAFIHSLEVNPETLETHLALGALMRRRGEVERAIRIHQNLLSHPRLSRNQLYQVQLELARDFMQAGLLDRAERLMLDVAEMSDQYRKQALGHLLEIYRDEQEWQKAIGVAGKLWPRRFLFQSGPGVLEQGHFCCELAEQALNHGDPLEARRRLRQALKFDKNSVRASLLLGRLDVRQGNYQSALKRLDRIPLQDAAYLPEAVESICTAYRELGREAELVPYLSKLYGEYPGDDLLLALVDKISSVDGKPEAVVFLQQQLDKALSPRGVLKLLELEYAREGERRNSTALLKSAFRQLLNGRAQYRCDSCGFAGRQLHWLCPTCKQWGVVKPVKGG